MRLRSLNACLLLSFALSCGGCAVILPLDSFQPDLETTQSISSPSTLLSRDMNEEDWRRAQSALSLAVDPQGSGQPVNWDNPANKKRGTFAAAGNFTLVDNTICRKFTSILVNHAKPNAPVENRHEGQACRVGPGEWTMHEIKPLMAATHKEAPQPMPKLAIIQPNG